jgi:hypothetical protein
MGRTINTRLSQTVRGRIVERMRHIAAEVGVAVVTVPPRDTSKRCPRCLTPLRHIKAPDKPTIAGWKWATCPNPACGWQGDRDQGAWRRIAARGLAHQTTTIVDRTSGPWRSAMWSTPWRRARPSHLYRRPRQWTGPRPAPPGGAQPPTPRPGDSGFPPRQMPASVRRDTSRGPRGCPAQPPGTRA